MRKMRRKKKHVQSSNFKNWNKISTPSSILWTQYNEYYLILREMRQDVAKEQYKEEHEPK
jgi:hypothetical protein